MPSVPGSLPLFLSPELGSHDFAEGDDGGSPSDWDVAIRFHDLRSAARFEPRAERELEARSVAAIVRRARGVLGRVPVRERRFVASADELRQRGIDGEIAIEETLDARVAGAAHEIRFLAREPAPVRIAIFMDTSLSMRGEKLALLAVAVTALAICVPHGTLALRGFDSSLRRIKEFDEELEPVEIARRILALPTDGYTDLEAALEHARREAPRREATRVRLLFVSDGKYTAGRDPAYLGDSISALSVLKPGRDRAGVPLLRELVRRSGGSYAEAPTFEALPRKLYEAARALCR